jgi:branched-chain amino acid transport system permease protein
MMVIMLVIGGVGSLHGAFIGAAIYLGSRIYLSSYTDRWQLLVGLVFVLTVLVMPNGIASGLPSLAKRFRRAAAVAMSEASPVLCLEGSARRLAPFGF